MDVQIHIIHEKTSIPYLFYYNIRGRPGLSSLRTIKKPEAAQGRLR
jgi:hypothetical protein